MHETLKNINITDVYIPMTLLNLQLPFQLVPFLLWDSAVCEH